MATKTIDYANAFFKDADGNVGHVHGLSKNDVTTLKNGIANAVVTTDTWQSVAGRKTFTDTLVATGGVEFSDATYMRVPEPPVGFTNVKYNPFSVTYCASNSAPATVEWVHYYLSSAWNAGLRIRGFQKGYFYDCVPVWHGSCYRHMRVVDPQGSGVYKTFDEFKAAWGGHPFSSSVSDLCLGDHFKFTVGTTTYYAIVAEIKESSAGNNGLDFTLLVTDATPIAMNSTASTVGGYVESTMHKTTTTALYTTLCNTEDAPFFRDGSTCCVSQYKTLSAGIDNTATNICRPSYKGVTYATQDTEVNLCIPTEMDFLGFRQLTGSTLDDCSSHQLPLFRYDSLYNILYNAWDAPLRLSDYNILTRSIASSTDYVGLTVSKYGVKAVPMDANATGYALYEMRFRAH